MAVTGSGTSADPYIVSTVAEFKEAINTTVNAYIRVIADLDFVNQSLISYKKGFTIIGAKNDVDNARVEFTNINCIDQPWIRDNVNEAYTNTFKDINFEFMIINSGDSQAGSGTGPYGWYTRHNLINGTTNGNQFASKITFIFTNCNMKIKIYLCSRYTREMRYNLFNIKGITNCNITVDVYFIMAKQTLCLIKGGDLTYNVDYPLIKDSIIKVTYYDPNSWALPVSYTTNDVTGNNWDACCSTGRYVFQDVSFDNCGILTNFKADADMTESKSKLNILYNGNGGDGRCYILNSYFIHKNLGMQKVGAVLFYPYFATYSFYDKETLDNDGVGFAVQSAYYHFSSVQFKGLTSAQCINRVTFEGDPTTDPPTKPVLPFKLRQPIEP